MCATGATHYVSTSGSDSNAGTLAQPFSTLNKAVSVLRPGDTLYVRGGTYVESLSNNIPGGTSWSKPVTIAAYPGETVIIQAASSGFGVVYLADASRSDDQGQTFALRAKQRYGLKPAVCAYPGRLVPGRAGDLDAPIDTSFTFRRRHRAGHGAMTSP